MFISTKLPFSYCGRFLLVFWELAECVDFDVYTELRRNINVSVIDHDSHSVIDLIEQVLERITGKLKVTLPATQNLCFSFCLKNYFTRGFFFNKYLGYTISVSVSIRDTLLKVISTKPP